MMVSMRRFLFLEGVSSLSSLQTVRKLFLSISQDGKVQDGGRACLLRPSVFLLRRGKSEAGEGAVVYKQAVM